MAQLPEFLQQVDKAESAIDDIQGTLESIIQFPSGDILGLIGFEVDFGLNGLPGVFGIASCFMSIEELIERQIKKIIEDLMEIAAANILIFDLIMEAINTISAVLDAISDLINQIKTELLGIIGLITCIQNGDAEAKIDCIATLAARYGLLPESLQQILDFLADLDICDLITGKVQVPGLPFPGPVGTAVKKSVGVPTPISPGYLNGDVISQKAENDLIRKRVGEAITAEDEGDLLPESDEKRGMLTTLTHMSTAMYSAISNAADATAAQAKIARWDRLRDYYLKKNELRWTQDVRDEFIERAGRVFDSLKKGVDTETITKQSAGSSPNLQDVRREEWEKARVLYRESRGEDPPPDYPSDEFSE